jgi:hypothetical protein
MWRHEEEQHLRADLARAISFRDTAYASMDEVSIALGESDVAAAEAALRAFERECEVQDEADRLASKDLILDD